MRIWLISDTHNRHGLLEIPEVDMVVHGGDMSNNKEPAVNNNEVRDFLDWYKSLHIKYKVLIAGNHDTSIEKGLVTRGDIHESITYLEHEYAEVGGIKIFGSPYTPNFGHNWAFNVPRGKLSPYWDDIPQNLDILVTHGPPKGVLDLTQYDTRVGADGQSFFQCGCKELLDAVIAKKPKYHVFGHIHPETNCPNAAQMKIQHIDTMFINAAVCNFGKSLVDDTKYKYIHNNGFVLEL